MQVKTQGLIIREQTVGESDRLVTVLTRDAGVVRAFARRAKNLKDSKSAADVRNSAAVPPSRKRLTRTPLRVRKNRSARWRTITSTL